jgi:type VI secretion system protein ImpH
MSGSLLSRLVERPRRFGFDAAVRVLMRARRTADPAEATRFRTWGGMGYPPADVMEVARPERGGLPETKVAIGGLTGPTGVLPRFYTEQVTQQNRIRSGGLHAFLDMLSHRMIAAFAKAGIKYRPARSQETAALAGAPDPQRQVMLALVGEADTARSRSAAERDTILHYGGLFAAWPRSADRLEALLTEWFGRTVTVVQFAGGWLNLPPEERTRLPKGRDLGQYARLGHDAAIGARGWDPRGRVGLRIDDLTLDEFRALLPDHPDAWRLTALARQYLGPGTDFAVNPVLRADQVPPCRLGGDTRMGWDTWLHAARRGADAADAEFPARQIERMGRRAA